MALLLRNVGRCSGVLAGFNSSLWQKYTTTCVRPMAALADQQGESFWDKNKRLQRPLSPHLTIYKWEMTMNMSLLHRFTGIVLTSGVYGFALAMLALPEAYPHYVNAVQALHLAPELLYTTKFLLAFPLIFHTCSGTRHLFWDLGKGFSLKSLYISGYAAVALAFAITAVVAAC